MKSFFFNKSEHKDVLYIPNNLIVITDNRMPNAPDINYSPNNLQVYDLIWESKNTIEKRRILGDAMKALELNVDDKTLDIFRGFCFGQTSLDIINAHLYAKDIFDLAKEKVSIFLKR